MMPKEKLPGGFGVGGSRPRMRNEAMARTPMTTTLPIPALRTLPRLCQTSSYEYLAMRHLLLATLLCAAAVSPGQAQNASPVRELEATLTFETTHSGTTPSGWGGGPASTI